MKQKGGLPLLLIALLAAILLIGFVTTPSAAQAAPRVCWKNPTQNVDGTDLTDLEKVRVYWGAASRSYDDSLDVPTDIPGDQVCADLSLQNGDYYVTATAFDSAGNESGYSNEILKSVLAPEPPIAIELQVFCPLCESLQTELLVGTTGDSVTLSWTPDGADRLEIEIHEYPIKQDATPVAQGSVDSSNVEWVWVASRAGLFYSRQRTCTGDVCSAWANSPDQGYLYYMKLAAPTGGGIE